MTDQDLPIPPSSSDRTVLGCRVSQDVQDEFGSFVQEHFENRKGAFGYCVEQALKEYMDNDRYHRVSDRLSDMQGTVAETNALVRQIITAEKEKGAFLEPAPKGNQAGDRLDRENAVATELAEKVAGGHSRAFEESELNTTITEVAQVSSEPSKRDYRESLMERELIDLKFGKYELTDKAFELSDMVVTDQ